MRIRVVHTSDFVSLEQILALYSREQVVEMINRYCQQRRTMTKGETNRRARKVLTELYGRETAERMVRA